MKIYIVKCKHIKSGEEHISQEGYKTYRAVTDFIYSRSDKPIQISDFTFKGQNNFYYIYEISVKNSWFIF